MRQSLESNPSLVPDVSLPDPYGAGEPQALPCSPYLPRVSRRNRMQSHARRAVQEQSQAAERL